AVPDVEVGVAVGTIHQHFEVGGTFRHVDEVEHVLAGIHADARHGNAVFQLGGRIHLDRRVVVRAHHGIAVGRAVGHDPDVPFAPFGRGELACFGDGATRPRTAVVQRVGRRRAVADVDVRVTGRPGTGGQVEDHRAHALRHVELEELLVARTHRTQFDGDLVHEV